VGLRVTAGSLSRLREWSARLGADFTVHARAPVWANPAPVSEVLPSAVCVSVINRLWCPSESRKRVFALVMTRTLHARASSSSPASRSAFPLSKVDRVSILPVDRTSSSSREPHLDANVVICLTAPLPRTLSSDYLGNKLAAFEPPPGQSRH